MKLLRSILLVALIIAVSVVSFHCENEETGPEEPQSMRDLDVPDGFNYTTSHNVPVKAFIPEGVPWRTTYVMSTDGDNVFYKGMPADSAERSVEGFVHIPDYIENVLLKYGDGSFCETEVVPVTSEGIIHNFTKKKFDLKSMQLDVDTDGDQVVDSEDDYPNDSSRAYNIYYPGGTGQLKNTDILLLWNNYAFEDLWPGYGDYDFNDLVVDFYYLVVVCNTWYHGQYIAEIYPTYKFRAIGATFENGFGVELLGIPYSDIENVFWRFEGGAWSDDFTSLLTEGYIDLRPNNVEDGQENAVFIISDNVDNVLPNPGGSSFVNTVQTAPYQPPVILNLRITFPWVDRPYYGCDIPWYAYPWTNTALCYDDVNPFIIINKERGKEVHMSDFPPTDLVNTSYFGTKDDDSDPATGRYYKSANNLPWGLDIAYSFEYPLEKNDIIFAYPQFVDWAESGGTVNPDWYLPEHGDESHIYQVPD